MNEIIFKQDAKTIVDLIFDTKIFKDSLTRDHINAVEEFVSDALYSRFKSYQKAEKILKSLAKIKPTILP